jgi:hypothetical protein
MDTYVAGSTHDIHHVNYVQRAAIEAGHTITFDWTGPEGVIHEDWSPYADEGAVHSQREVAAAKCDLFILVTPQHAGGVGCFIEFGIALGHGALCYVFPLKDRDSVFFYHPHVFIIKSKRNLTYDLRVAHTRHYRLTHKQH